MAKWPWLVVGAFIATPIAVALSARKRKSLGAIIPTAERPTAQALTIVDEFYPEPRPDEDDCLILGRMHPSYHFGEYRVCLTDNQKQTLFKGKVGKKLGCGVFACAYASGPHKVVKFTRDSEDVAALLEAQKTGVVPKVYDVFKLKDGGHSINTDDETPVYAMTIERLRTLPRDERIRMDQEEISQAFAVIDNVKSGQSPSVDAACAEQECGPIARETAQAALALHDAGIDWTDIHAGNIGFDRKGRVKVLDLGLTSTQLKAEPKILAGARRRRLAKLRSA